MVMKRTMIKDLFREIKGSFGRFLAIFSIVLLGVAFFAGVSAAPSNMRYTADRYFDEYRLQDIRLISSIGFNEEDIRRIRETEGILGVCPARTVDVLAREKEEEGERVLSITSIPADPSMDNEDYINRFRILEGRLPEDAGECAVRASMANSALYHVGDRLVLRSGTDYDIGEILSEDEVTVVGIVYTPYAISFDLGTSSIGNGSIDALAYLPEEAFLTDYYTNVYVTAKGAKDADTFSDAYFSRTAPLKDALDALGSIRISERTEELKKEIYTAVSDEVTEQVTAAVTEEVEQVVSAQIADTVREEVEAAVRTGIEDEVRAQLEAAVEDGIQQTTREQVEQAVRTGMENTVRSRVEAAVRSAIETQVLEAVEQEARDQIAAAVRTEVEAQVQEGFAAEVRSRVTEEVKNRIASEVLNTVTENVKATLAETVRNQVTEQARTAISEQVLQELTDTVTAEVNQQILLKYLPESMKEEAIKAGVALLYPSAYQKALDTYLEAAVNEAYPAAYSAAEAQYLEAYVNEAYPAAYSTAEAQYLETYVEEALPAALQEAMAAEEYQTVFNTAYEEALQTALQDNLQAAIDSAYPAALQAAIQENFQKTVDEQYPAALQEAMKGFDALVEEQYQAVIGTALSENLEKTVDEKYPDALQEALEENLEKTVDEKYPEALQEAMETHYQSSVNEHVRLETGKLLPEKINEVYQEQLKENLEGASDWQWYVLDRNYQVSYVEYKSVSEQMDQIAILFPLFFFFVAALVCFTTMTRMVSEQRVLIGTYKALGYSTFPIAMRYVLYALSAALSGGTAGAFLGIQIFPLVIFNAWGIAYQMPAMQQADHRSLMAVSVLSITAAVVLAAVVACAGDASSDPTKLMRPKAPKLGKTVLLERIGFLWRRLSFTGKVTVRNLFR